MISEGVGIHNPAQGVVEDVGVFPVVESPFEFFQIEIEMLGADLMEGTDNRTLEQRPYAFYAVGVNFTNHPFLNSVADSRMARVLMSNPQVGFQFIGIDGFRFVFDVAADEVMQGVPPDIGDALDPHIPAALDGSGNPGLSRLATRSHSTPSASDQGFINLDHTEQGRPRGFIRTHSRADAVAKIPRCLVGDSQNAFELVGRDAFPGLDHEVNGDEPFPEREVGIVHNGSSRDAELIAAREAIPLISVRNLAQGSLFASRTTDFPLGPPKVFQEFPAFVFGREAIN